MDISLLENKYADLKQAYDNNSIDAEAFQAAVDALRAQDDYGRFWTLGAESGKWYYFDGREWVQADPAEADALPFIDEEGVYWMLGRESKEWYYFDGEKWIRPDEAAQPAAAAGPVAADTESNQYYQDEDGRYWALGKKSGEWYYYDETGWHPADDLKQNQPQPAYQSYAGPAAQPSAAPPHPHTVPFQPIQPTPNYYQPSGQEYTQPVQPQQPYGSGPSPSQPVYPQNYTQPVGPQPQYDPQAYPPPPQPTQPPPPQPEPGSWMYFDGQQWVRYQEAPNAHPPAGAYQEDYFEEDSYVEAEDVGDDEIIQVDDLNDFVEVVEVDETDIIEADEDEELVEAEFHVEVLTPEEEAAATAAAAQATAAQAEAHTMPLKAEPAPAATPQSKTGATPRVTSRPQPQTEYPEVRPRGMPAWLVTSVIGIFALAFVAALLIGGLHTFTNSRETNPTAVAQIETPTLAISAPQTTPTVAATPLPTATEPAPPTEISLAVYDSPDFGFSIEYPSGWVSDQQDDLAIFAPSSRSLNTTQLNGAALWVTRSSSQDLTRLLADGLEQFEPIGQTLNEGTMLIGAQSWASAQVEFDSEDMGGKAIALVASTVRDEAGYTLIAVAPATEWEDYIQLFQKAVDSFEFRSQAVAAVESQTPTATSQEAGDASDDEATATATATATPEEPETVEPIVHVVAAGDTLGAIAVRYDVAVAEIVAANNLSSQNAILAIGQELAIPQEGVAVAIAPTATPEAEESPAATPTTAADVDEPEAAATPTPTTAPTPTVEAAPSLTGFIAYPVYSTDINSFNVWVANIDGSNPQIVGGNASQPKFSRDGGLLAYRSWIPSQRGIYFLDFKGGRQGLLTSFIEDGLPAWSPDDTIVFSSRREGDRIPRLYRVTQRGNDSQSLGFISEYADTMPDGRLVARGCTPSGDCGLWVTLPDGSGEVKISVDTSDTAPASNPQGTRIAIMSSGRGGANNWEIWTIDPDGNNARRLTNNGSNDGLPTWSPDGRSIAFVSDREGVWAIWVMNSDGSNQRKLFNMQGPPDGQVLHDVPNSHGWLEERISWSP